MSVPRLAAAAFATLALSVGVGSATAHSTQTAPTNLHGFLLRADEPAKTAFTRTPAFAWNPVSAAEHYEFQLSTSDTFRDNAIIWSKSDLQGPVAAPPVTLPWISGSPHSMYARVRAYLTDGTVTQWSDDYGFDMTPPPAPSPLASAPGLLRWTPVEGADGYEVWLIDAGKQEVVYSNVLDEREYYTFHPTSRWAGTVHWRVRALRDDNVTGRLNGVPVAQWGPWSQVYTSSNPTTKCPPPQDTPLGHSSCPIQVGSLLGSTGQVETTFSDVVSNGAPSDPAHRLMPGFAWTGNETLDGTPAELYRVYVFTDKQCLNRVYTGGVVGSPAYAPRPYGPLQLPTTDLLGARAGYLPDGSETADVSYDGLEVTPTEQEAAATPTTTLPLVNGAAPTGATGTGGSASSSAPQSTPFLDWGDSKFGAPIDLWDTKWPAGGYYWTVVAVEARQPGALLTSVAPPGGVAGVTNLPVANSAGFGIGDTITVGSGANAEKDIAVIGVAPGVLTLAKALAQGHGPGEPVVRTGGSIRYVDLELPQDVCAAGRVARFGISSEPSLSSAGDPFASGLSAGGTLTSATSTSTFYKQPVVAWTPALRAEAYQLQWSKTQYPFVPEADPASGAQGILTGANAYVLPVAPGTWYYRVRGLDYSLPTGAQQMGWSDIAQVKIAEPTFVVVGGSGAASTKHKTKPAAKKKTQRPVSAMRTYSFTNFSIAVPRTWKRQTAKDMDFAAFDPAAPRVAMVEHIPVTRGTVPADQWATLLAQEIQKGGTGLDVTSAVSHKVVTINGSPAALLTFRVKYRGYSFSTYAYVFDSGSESYLVMLMTIPKLEKQSAPVFGRIAASFRLH